MKTTFVVLPLLVAPALLLMALPARTAEPDPKDEAVVREVVAARLAAANAHDPKAAVKHFHPDATLTNPLGQVLRGPAEIEKLYEALHAGDPKRGIPSLKNTVVKHDRETIRFLRPDVATVGIVYTSTGGTGPDGKALGAQKGWLHYVITREKGTWGIAEVHVMELHDLTQLGDKPAK
jgi:uncharacterized protein (TIGR02246 family)